MKITVVGEKMANKVEMIPLGVYVDQRLWYFQGSGKNY